MSQHLKSRPSKISGPFGTHSSLFLLNHLAFQSSVKLLLLGQYLLSAPRAALQLWPKAQLCRKCLHYLLLKPRLQMLHTAFIQRLPSIRLPKRWWSTFHPNAPTRALLPATNDDAPLAGSLCWSVSPIYHPITTVGIKKPRNQRNLTASQKIRLIRGTWKKKILTHLPLPFSVSQDR